MNDPLVIKVSVWLLIFLFLSGFAFGVVFGIEMREFFTNRIGRRNT